MIILYNTLPLWLSKQGEEGTGGGMKQSPIERERRELAEVIEREV
jgi:hypothetical protein